jgi:S1-C subfamily serine protease
MLVAAAVLLLAAGGTAAQEIRELASATRPSVVLLRLTEGGRTVGGGTGFVVQGGLVATNHHVVDRARAVEAVTEDGSVHLVAGIVAADAANDLALLSVPTLDAAPLPLAAPGNVEPGDRVVVIGSPLGLAGTVSDGIVSAVRPDGLGEASRVFRTTAILQITAPISPGSSGSPVLDADGEVIGVAVAYLVGGQSLNLAVPTGSLLDLMSRSDLSSLERELGGGGPAGGWEIARNLGISVVFFALLVFSYRRLRD